MCAIWCIMQFRQRDLFDDSFQNGLFLQFVNFACVYAFGCVCVFVSIYSMIRTRTQFFDDHKEVRWSSRRIIVIVIIISVYHIQTIFGHFVNPAG